MPAIPLLRCFGSFQLEWQGQPITLPTRKTAALLAYLVLHPEVHQRTRLVTLFWGDFGEDAARRSLRTALSALRIALGDDCLVADRETVQFNPDYAIWMDARVLQTQARHFLDQPTPDPSLVDITLYQGDLLAGMEEDWILRTREALRLLYLQVLLRLAQHWRTQGDYAQAIAMAQRILTLEPAEEAAHQLLLFCYMAAGDRQAAHGQYEACVQALREELDVAPALDTVTLYRRSQRTPPRAPVSAVVQTNLPLPLSSFIGRSHEIARLTALLGGAHAAGERQAARLVTVTGPGGCGKTRLAIQVACDLLDRYPAGVWWVDLAPLREESQVPQALASVFSVEQGVQVSLTAALVNYLRPQHLLVVLDNCEHLITACATLVEHLLNYCPNLQILATSREALNIGGEISWLVPSLTLPGLQPDPAPHKLLQFEAIRLFVERASATQHDFALTAANAPAVCQICQQLDGIPLAIELAAARVKVMTVEQMATRLGGVIGARFALLTAGSRIVLPRQQTLRAMMEWSYALLNEPEQQLLQQLSVFAGGWTLEAAEALGEGTEAQPVAAVLAHLVDKSLVAADQQGLAVRYRMLETIRQYADEQLEKLGKAAVTHDRHLGYFLHLAEQAEPEFRAGGQLTWLQRLDTESENLSAALTWGLQSQVGSGERLLMGATLATTLIFYWRLHGEWREGRHWLEAAARKIDCDWQTTESEPLHQITSLRAKARYGAGLVAWHQGKWDEARHLLDASIECWRSIGEQTGRYRAQVFQADLCVEQKDRTTAFALWQECLAYFRQVEDRWDTAETSFHMGYAERRTGNLSVASRYYEDCIALIQPVEERWLLSLAMSHLGIIALEQGHYDIARTHMERRLVLGREFGLKHHTYTALSYLAQIAYKQGQIRQGALLLREALTIERQAGADLFQILMSYDKLVLLALACMQDGQATRAVRLLAARDIRLPSDFYVRWKIEHAQAEQLLAELHARLGEDAFAAAWAKGIALTLDEVLEEALAEG